MNQQAGHNGSGTNGGAGSGPGSDPSVHSTGPHERLAEPTNSVPSVRAPIPLRREPVRATPTESESRSANIKLLTLSALALTLVLTVIMAFPILPGQVQIQPGMPASDSILSPVYLSYVSNVLTEKAKEQARNDPANEVWVQDKEVVERQRSKLLNVLSLVSEMRQNETLDTTTRHDRLSTLPEIQLSDPQIDALVSMSDADYRYWRDYGVLAAFDSTMNNRRITSSTELAAARTALPDLLVPALSAEQRDLAVAFLSPLITVNMRLDEEQTTARQEDASRVKPVIVTVQKGEAILRQGELATPESIEKMQQAGLLSRGISPQTVIGTVGIIMLLVILLHLYIYRYADQLLRRQKQLLLVDMLIAFTVGVAVLFLPGHTLLPYFLPVGAVSLLIAVLLLPNLAILVAFVLSMLLGMALGSSLSMELPIYYFVGSLAGVFTLTRVEKVSGFARAGFYIMVASFTIAFLLKIFTGTSLDWTTVGNLALAAVFNGGMSTALTYAAFSLLGTLFGITTPLQLMELAHPDQPLLRRLMREAPGTYHHSLVVSNLAERAAEMVGADSLLTRVCAYYHDIGKVEHPYYFIDNQAGRANVHDELSPWESAQIIARHVDDGMELAVKHNLPRRVVDAIPQHHGTMLVKYFYHKALEQDPDANPDEFRYHGPKPQTKENAILMLADGVEATVRSMAQSGALEKHALTNPDASESPSRYDDTASMPDDAIAAVIHKIITERIEDGQLDECDLTVRDIARIQEAFISMLKGIYHPRVVYPEKPRTTTDAALPASPAVPVPVSVAITNGHDSGAPARRGIRRSRVRGEKNAEEPHTPAAGM